MVAQDVDPESCYNTTPKTHSKVGRTPLHGMCAHSQSAGMGTGRLAAQPAVLKHQACRLASLISLDAVAAMKP